MSFISKEDKHHFDTVVFKNKLDFIHHQPYVYSVIDSPFTQDLYQKILRYSPNDKDFDWNTGKITFKNRGRLALRKIGNKISNTPQFWDEFLSWIFSPEMCKKWINKYRKELLILNPDLDKHKYRITGVFNRDKKGYRIGPHCDSRKKIITILLYFPETDQNKKIGTTVYIPKPNHAPLDDRKHHDFKDFDEVTTAEMIPNRIFEFLVFDKSWHGVKPVTEDITRNSIQLNISKEN